LNDLQSEVDVISRHKQLSPRCSFAVSAANNASSHNSQRDYDSLNSSVGATRSNTLLNSTTSEREDIFSASGVRGSRIFNDVTDIDSANVDDEDNGDVTDGFTSLAVANERVTSNSTSSKSTITAFQSLQQPTANQNSTLDFEKMKQEKFRLETFNSWPKKNQISPKPLAQNGFYFTGKNDVLKCAFCAVTLGGWKIDDEVAIRHKKNSPGCLFANSTNPKAVGNIPCTQSEVKVTSSQQSLLHPHAIQQLNVQQLPSPLAHTNAATASINKNISTDNDVEVDGTRSHTMDARSGSKSQSTNHIIMDPREIKARLDTPWSRKALELGFNIEVVRTVICERLTQTGQDFKSLAEFVEACFTKRDQLDVPPRDRERLQQQQQQQHVLFQQERLQQQQPSRQQLQHDGVQHELRQLMQEQQRQRFL
jgi:hypothetical protein